MITGSSSQVGKALINQFSKNYIIICIDKNISKINKLENVTYFKADVSNEKKMRNIKKKIEKKFNRIDIIINCFISQNYETFENQTLSKFNSAVTSNICGTFLITKLFYKH